MRMEGIFIFYDKEGNFRFSLVYAEYFGTRREFSHFKRYTYYVSPSLSNKTFIDQVGNADFSSLKSVKSAFSVSPVTREFYKEIQNWYFWAMDKVWFPEDYKHSEDPQKDEEIRIATSLIRLITRLMFVWFLKEKGLVPEDLFDKERLRGIVKDFGKGNNYYNAILQNLFFAVLNQKIEDRRFAKDDGFFANRNEYGVKTLLRYKDKFLISEEEVLELFGQIPFINGGLFDCLDKEDENGRVIYVDGFSRNPEKQAKVPDYLFFQEKEERVDLSKYGLGKREPVRGLIEILKSYNFTVDEATPIDQEIALDPEMLGKVFENLLAAYVPETAETARKATGSYYTPREIVDYMVDESLKEYFKTHSKLTEEQIEKLLSYTEDTPELTEDQRHEIIELIDRLKVLDPACGSGAFPMGILHKLVHILQKIDPNNELWYETQYQRAIKESEEAFKKLELDKSEREEILKEINESFDESLNYPDYARKLYLIENCIYGVDIQPIAVQISKLRFFISLLIDQKVDKSKENFGIRPLPNLETNFVAANTLIGLEGNNHIWRTQEIKDLEEQIKRVRHRYFNAKTRKQKLELQKKDKELREKLKEKLKKAKLPAETAEKIAKFNPYDQNASSDWFDPEWMFGVTDGFDIVIGNPPYVKQEKIKDKELICKFLKSFDKSLKIDKRSDLYVYFYYKGLQLLKPNGILCFISSNSWLDTSFGKSLREYLLKYTHPISIVYNAVEKTFEAEINTVIVLIKKSQSISQKDMIKFIVENDLKQNKVVTKTRKELFEEWNYTGGRWGLYLRAPDVFFKILEKGKGKIVKLGSIACVVSGVITGDNRKYYTPFHHGYDQERYLLAFKSPKDLKTIVCTKYDAKWLLKNEVRFLSKTADLLLGDTKHDRFVVHWNKDKLVFEHKLIGINPNSKDYLKPLLLMLNSTLFSLITELFGKFNLGEGALYINPSDVEEMLVVHPKFLEALSKENFEDFLKRPIKSIFEELGFEKCKKRNCKHPEHPLEYINPDELTFDRIAKDRRKLDKIVFEVLGLTEEEQLEVYKGLLKLVKERVIKARKNKANCHGQC